MNITPSARDHAPPAQATLHWHREPEALGMSREALLEAAQALEAGCASGLHPGAQLYVSRRGMSVMEFACGDSLADGPLTPDSVTAWFSSCKPITALAIALLYQRRALDLDDRVQRFIPEFANGKERCTVRQVLTHVGGFPNAFHDGTEFGWEEAISIICAAAAETEPGTRAAYHHSSGWYILGELVRRIDGRPIDRFVTEEIFVPLGMRESHMGMAPARQRMLGSRLARVALGRSEKAPYVDESFVRRFNATEEIARVNPGGGVRGPARDLGRLYEWPPHPGTRHGRAVHGLPPLGVAGSDPGERAAFLGLGIRFAWQFGPAHLRVPPCLLSFGDGVLRGHGRSGPAAGLHRHHNGPARSAGQRPASARGHGRLRARLRGAVMTSPHATAPARAGTFGQSTQSSGGA